jgi:CRP-like cAMP-binding protein
VAPRTIDRLVAEHRFFHGLNPADLELIGGCGRDVRFAAGEYLLREGQAADAWYLIRLGRVALEVFVPGRGPLVIESLAEGDVLGISWLFPPYRWQFDAEALELTRAVAFDGACLRARCEQDPRLGYELMTRFGEVMQRRLQSARLRLLDLYGDARAG